MTTNSNPYRPPETQNGAGEPHWFAAHRVLPVLPAMMPLIAHMLSRNLIPSDDSPFHVIFTFGALGLTVIGAWLMPGRWLPHSRTVYMARCLLLASLIAVGRFVFWVT